MQQRQMTFSFQTHHPIKQIINKEPNLKIIQTKQLQLFHNEISVLQKLTTDYKSVDKYRSKSTLDTSQQQTSITPLRQYSTLIPSQVAPFEPTEISDVILEDSKNQANAQTNIIEIQRLEFMEQKLLLLENKKDDLLLQLQSNRTDLQLIIQQQEIQIRQHKEDDKHLRQMLFESQEREKQIQKQFQQSNWKMLQMKEQYEEQSDQKQQFINQLQNAAAIQPIFAQHQSIQNMDQATKQLYQSFLELLNEGDFQENILNVSDFIQIRFQLSQAITRSRNQAKSILKVLIFQAISIKYYIVILPIQTYLLSHDNLNRHSYQISNKCKPKTNNYRWKIKVCKNNQISIDRPQIIFRTRGDPTRFEAELLSTEESISLIFEICQKAICSNEMMKQFQIHGQLMQVLSKIVQNSQRKKSEQISQSRNFLNDQSSIFEQTQNYNQNYQINSSKNEKKPYDQITTNKKSGQMSIPMQQRRNFSVNL